MIEDTLRKLNQIILPDEEIITMPDIADNENNNPIVTMIPDFCNKKQYMIIPSTRIIVIDSTDYKIADFFNIENAMIGEYKTLDYIFCNIGFNINDFEIVNHTKSTIQDKDIPF